jgi:hypothetical protein
VRATSVRRACAAVPAGAAQRVEGAVYSTGQCTLASRVLSHPYKHKAASKGGRLLRGADLLGDLSLRPGAGLLAAG